MAVISMMNVKYYYKWVSKRWVVWGYGAQLSNVRLVISNYSLITVFSVPRAIKQFQVVEVWRGFITKSFCLIQPYSYIGHLIYVAGLFPRRGRDWSLWRQPWSQHTILWITFTLWIVQTNFHSKMAIRAQSLNLIVYKELVASLPVVWSCSTISM